MAARVELKTDMTVLSNEGFPVVLDERIARWPALADNGKREVVSLPATTFTALTVPSGASCVMMFPKTTSDTLLLKSITGDGGIAITPASNVLPIPVILPLGASPNIGILNSGSSAETIELLWL